MPQITDHKRGSLKTTCDQLHRQNQKAKKSRRMTDAQMTEELAEETGITEEKALGYVRGSRRDFNLGIRLYGVMGGVPVGEGDRENDAPFLKYDEDGSIIPIRFKARDGSYDLVYPIGTDPDDVPATSRARKAPDGDPEDKPAKAAKKAKATEKPVKVKATTTKSKVGDHAKPKVKGRGDKSKKVVIKKTKPTAKSGK